MNTLLQQFKKGRLDLGLKQNDMMLRVGVSRQQYQRLEYKGNPRLDTLELIAKGLNSEIMLIPKEKLGSVLAVLEGRVADEWEADSKGPGSEGSRFDQSGTGQRNTSESESNRNLSDGPWQGFLGDDS